MAQVELIMPKMGESIMEATILKWVKNVGDTIESEEAVLEIATDKVDSEVPAPCDGVLGEILFQEGDVVEVGKVIAIINTDGDSAAAPAPAAAQPAQAAAPVEVPHVPSPAPAAATGTVTEGRFYSPLVLNIARQEGISMATLETLPGTGKDGRVTKKDIFAFVKSGGAQAAPAPSQTVTAPQVEVRQEVKHAPAVIENNDPNVEVIEMDRMRKMIADHMVMSKQTSPHVTSFVEADVTNLVLWRNKVKNEFAKREGEKITFTPIFVEAVAQAIKEFPLINSSVNDGKIYRKKNINIGMAAAMPNGNLIVPVIKNADQLNLTGLAKNVNDLAGRARANKLKPDEIQGGTFTLTNVGTFGNLMGTPIINQPQVAILATGAIKKKPVVMETDYGDTIAIRHMMFLSHSYDHRIVDGAMGGAFVRRVADILESWDVNRGF